MSKFVRCLLVLALSLAALTLLQCSDDDKNPLVVNSLVPRIDGSGIYGTWKWDATYGCGYVTTPDSTGFSVAMLLYQDYRYEEYIDGLLAFTGQYTLAQLDVAPDDTRWILVVENRPDGHDSLVISLPAEESLTLDAVPRDSLVGWEYTVLYSRMK